MNDKDNGGPAFPTDDANWLTPDLYHYAGMSLRDYFAAQALAGNIEQGTENDMASAMPDVDGWWHSPSKIARRAYAIADAMLKERAK